ncbi:hypothetical protein ABW636_04830 [Aquimarina sp. 2201CG1-2-11]|uniref:hypothetical protein n=1 Tax=Aquimarina discodermiae TaxID=3231043 RepID=UPI0034629E79
MKLKLITISLLAVTSCATIPTEFLIAIEKEKEGIDFLHKRHQRSVNELVSNWHAERLEKLTYIKEIEINKAARTLTNSKDTIQVLKKEDFIRIETQFDSAIKIIDKIRVSLIDRYSDTKNWKKLKELSATNYNMSKSLLELNQAQKRLYREVLKTNALIPLKKASPKNIIAKKGNTTNKL